MKLFPVLLLVAVCSAWAGSSWHYKCGNDLCIKLTLRHKLKAKSFNLIKPDRWVLDIPKKNLLTRVQTYSCRTKLCNKIRVGVKRRNSTRIVV